MDPITAPKPPVSLEVPSSPQILISTEPVAAPAPPPPAKPKFRITKMLIIIFILLFLAVSISGFFAGYTQNNSYEPTPTPTPSSTPLAVIEPTPIEISSPTPVSSSPNPESQIQSKTIKATTTLDGYAASNGSGNNTVDIRVGRNTFAVTRGFVSFDLTTLPDNIEIESANLKLYQTHVTGDPYSIGGSLKIDHMEFGDILDGNDYALAPLQTNLATLTTNSDVEWKEVVVTEALKQDIKNSRLRSQYRLSFATETIGGESGGDFAYFESGENFVGTGNIPELLVRYKN